MLLLGQRIGGLTGALERGRKDVLDLRGAQHRREPQRPPDSIGGQRRIVGHLFAFRPTAVRPFRVPHDEDYLMIRRLGGSQTEQGHEPARREIVFAS